MYSEADQCGIDQSTDRHRTEQDHVAEPPRWKIGGRRHEQRPRDRDEDQQESGAETGVRTSEPVRQEGQDGQNGDEQEVGLGEPVAEQIAEGVFHRRYLPDLIRRAELQYLLSDEIGHHAPRWVQLVRRLPATRLSRYAA